MTTRVRDTITGRFVKKIMAALKPSTTVTEVVRPSFNKTELKLLQAALLTYPSVKQEKLREHVLEKLKKALG